MFGYFFSVSYRFISFSVGVCDDDVDDDVDVDVDDDDDVDDDSAGEFGINVFSSILVYFIIVLLYCIVYVFIIRINFLDNHYRMILARDSLTSFGERLFE